MGKFENTQIAKALKKLRASPIFLLHLDLHARRASNPQPLAPEANDVLFTSHCFYNT